MRWVGAGVQKVTPDAFDSRGGVGERVGVGRGEKGRGVTLARGIDFGRTVELAVPGHANSRIRLGVQAGKCFVAGLFPRSGYPYRENLDGRNDRGLRREPHGVQDYRAYEDGRKRRAPL